MDIVSRSEWGARYPAGAGPAPDPATSLWLHHTAGSGRETVRDLEAVGQQRFGAGMSYTFLADQAGTAYEGTGPGRRGAHTRGLNTTGRAVCAIGNFETTDPTPALLETLAQLAAEGYREGWWSVKGYTGGHRDAPGASTACPGSRLQARIPDINRRSAEILAGAPPKKEGFLMALTDDQQAALYNEVMGGKDKNGHYRQKRFADIVNEIRRDQRVLARAVADLAEVQGADYRAQLIDIAERRDDAQD